MISGDFPSRPWEKLGSDLFYSHGQNYLFVVDFFSRFIEIVKLSSTSSQVVISQIKVIMSRMGVCYTLVTDGGPQHSSQQFKQDFANFMAYGISLAVQDIPVEILPQGRTNCKANA